MLAEIEAMRASLADRLAALEAAADTTGGIDDLDAVRERLRSLGYVD